MAGDGVIVVSVKLAVVNLPRVPEPLLPAAVEGAVELGVEVFEGDNAEVMIPEADDEAGLVALGVDILVEELNAVIVSNDTVGFLIFPSLTCKTENLLMNIKDY